MKKTNKYTNHDLKLMKNITIWYISQKASLIFVIIAKITKIQTIINHKNNIACIVYQTKVHQWIAFYQNSTFYISPSHGELFWMFIIKCK